MQAAASGRTSTWAAGVPAAEPHFFGIEWNAENQLKRVLKNAVEQARFAYDPIGRRVERVAGGTTTGWTYDSEDMLREVTGGSTLKYVHGLGLDDPLGQEDGAGTLGFFHVDGLGSVVKNTSAAGTVTSSRRYDAFGTFELGLTNGYAFTGREWDTEAGLAYYRARYYDPKIGRFISADPIGLSGGINFYAYVENRPTTWKDPFGLMSWPEAQAKGMTWNQWWNDPSTTEQDQVNAETLDPNPPIDPTTMVAGGIAFGGAGKQAVQACAKRASCAAKLAFDLGVCYATFSKMPKSLGACIFAAQSNYRMCILGVPWPI